MKIIKKLAAGTLVTSLFLVMGTCANLIVMWIKQNYPNVLFVILLGIIGLLIWFFGNMVVNE